MNEKEIKIRKQWLALLFALMILSSMSTVFLPLERDSLALLNPWVAFGVKAYTIIYPVFFGFLLYHCIYKKPGTKLLTVLLVFIPMAYAGLFEAWFFGTLPNTFEYLIFTLLSTGLSAWWYCLLWKMRIINKKRQAQLKTTEVV